MDLCCDILHLDEVVGRLEIKNDKLIKNEVYTTNLLKHPFPRSTTLDSVLHGILDRVVRPERCDDYLLNLWGFKEYNAYDLFKSTHGVDVADFIWFRFDGEDLHWKDVSVRDKV